MPKNSRTEPNNITRMHDTKGNYVGRISEPIIKEEILTKNGKAKKRIQVEFTSYGRGGGQKNNSHGNVRDALKVHFTKGKENIVGDIVYEINTRGTYSWNFWVHSK